METKIQGTTTLPQFAVFVLAAALEQPGWAVTSRDHGATFQLLETVLPECKLPDELRARMTTQRQARQEFPLWCSEPIALSISEKQRDTIKKCLQTLRDRGALMPGWATYSLLSTFGLADD